MVSTIHIRSHGTLAEILIDGVPLKGALLYRIKHNGGENPVMFVQIQAQEIVIDGEFDVTVKRRGHADTEQGTNWRD